MPDRKNPISKAMIDGKEVEYHVSMNAPDDMFVHDMDFLGTGYPKFVCGIEQYDTDKVMYFYNPKPDNMKVNKYGNYNS